MALHSVACHAGSIGIYPWQLAAWVRFCVLLRKVFLAELQLELQPGLVRLDFGKFVAATAMRHAGDAQLPCLVPHHHRCPRGVDPIARSGIGVDEDRRFPLVHVAQGEVLRPDRLHDADHHRGTRALACGGILRTGIGEIVVVAQELADQRPSCDAAAAEALRVDVPIRRLGAHELYRRAQWVAIARWSVSSLRKG